MIYFKRVVQGSRKRPKGPKELSPVLRVGGCEGLHCGYGPKGRKNSAQSRECGAGKGDEKRPQA